MSSQRGPQPITETPSVYQEMAEAAVDFVLSQPIRACWDREQLIWHVRRRLKRIAEAAATTDDETVNLGELSALMPTLASDSALLVPGGAR